MNLVGQPDVWSFFDDAPRVKKASNRAIRSAAGCTVTSYMDLARRVAELQYRNSDLILLFRGQSRDYKSKRGLTTVMPKLLRLEVGQARLAEATVRRRLEMLEAASDLLQSRYEATFRLGRTRIWRQRLLRWAVLQHYEVCATPLLDVTHSIRVAASFASIAANKEAYFFVLGIPYLSGGVTVSAEAGLQIVRLSSVCPPAAVRPHIQEGYVISEYPEIGDYKQVKLYPTAELDFGRRLVAKFRFDPELFWNNSPTFPQVHEGALYPTVADDPLKGVADEIQSAIGRAYNVRA